MKTKSIISKILILPREFHSSDNNQSMHSLLLGTGYFQAYNNITEIKVKEALEQQPEVVDQWLSWSENKRADSGWYFIQYDNQKYEVGFVDPDIGTTKKMEYSDRRSACASFIKYEIESIRKS